MEQAGIWDESQLQQLPIPVFVVAVDSWYVHETNPTGSQLLGDSRDSIVGSTLSDHANERAEAFADTLEEMATVDGTSRRRKLPDGSPILVDGDTDTGIPVELRGRLLDRANTDQLAVVMQSDSVRLLVRVACGYRTPGAFPASRDRPRCRRRSSTRQ